MSKPTVSAREVITDIRSGMSDATLMEKYGLSAKGLQRLFGKLLKAGAIQQRDLDQRAELIDSVALEGIDEEFGRKRLLSGAKTELKKLKRKIESGDIPTEGSKRESVPHALDDLMDPFDWLLHQIGKGDQYTRWAMARAEVIEITPMSALFPDRTQFDILRERVAAKKDSPIAVAVCQTIEAGYCEGWIISGLVQNLPIKHSWNRLGDHFFDLKLELALEELSEAPSPIYILAQELDPGETLATWSQFREELRDVWFGELGRLYWKERIR